MTKENSLIIGAVAESPYAEFMGEINNPFCYNKVSKTEGCSYNDHLNPYMPL